MEEETEITRGIVPLSLPTYLHFQTSARHLLGHTVRLSCEAATHTAIEWKPIRTLFCRQEMDGQK